MSKRISTRTWKFILRISAEKAERALEIIKSQWIEFIKTRREGPELKTAIEQVEAKFDKQPDEGGLAVYNGELQIRHKTSIDYLSFPRLRKMLISTVPIETKNLHLEEVKRAPKSAPVAMHETKMEIKEPEPKPNLPVPAAPAVPVPNPETKTKNPPEIGILPEPVSTPRETPTLKPAERQLLNQASRPSRASRARVRPETKAPDSTPVTPPPSPTKSIPPAPAPAPAPTPAPAPAPVPVPKVHSMRKFDKPSDKPKDIRIHSFR